MEEENPSLRENIVTFMDEKMLPGVPHYTASREVAPTVGAQSADRLAQGSGMRRQPGGQHGADVPAPALDSLTNNVIVGPYNVGRMVSLMDFGGITGMLLLGSAVNVTVSGYLINMVAQRPSPLDPFGLLVSGGAQAGMGMFLSGMPSTQARK